MPTSVVPRELDDYDLKNEILCKTKKRDQIPEEKALLESADSKQTDGILKQFLRTAMSLHYFTLFAWFAVGNASQPKHQLKIFYSSERANQLISSLVQQLTKLVVPWRC